MTRAPKRKPRTPPKNAVTPASFGGPKPRTFKVWVFVETGFVFFNWQHSMNAKCLRACGYERATLTLTGKGKGKT